MTRRSPERSIEKTILAVVASLALGIAVMGTATAALAHGGGGGHFGGSGHFVGGGHFGRGFRGRFGGGFGGYYGPYYGYGYGSCYVLTPYGYDWVCY
jgi:uncharacterized membrane protein